MKTPETQVTVIETDYKKYEMRSTIHLKHKFRKKFLRVFHDWKFYQRGSREVSRENLCVPLATRPSTRKQVTIVGCEKHKKLNFEKYSKYFSQLGH